MTRVTSLPRNFAMADGYTRFQSRKTPPSRKHSTIGFQRNALSWRNENSIVAAHTHVGKLFLAFDFAGVLATAQFFERAAVAAQISK